MAADPTGNRAALALLNARATVQLGSGDLVGAIDTIRRMCGEDPTNPVWPFNLGVALIRAGMAHDALAPLNAALALRPAYGEAHDALGSALMALGDRKNAEAHFRQALDIDPRNAEFVTHLCDVWIDADELDLARAFLDGMLARDPDNRAARFRLGHVELLAGNLDAATQSFERDAAMAPPHAPTFLNLGTLSSWQNRSERAELHFRRAIELQPDYVEAQENLGYELLRQRRFREGWKLFEVRRGGTAAPRAVKRSVPTWTGEADPRTRLLLLPEQGFGDVIQFARFARLARKRVGHTMLLVDGYWRPLRRLLAGLEGVDEILDFGSTRVSLSAECPLLSLPALLDLDEADLAIDAPYLAPRHEDVEAWARRLPPTGRLRVGLTWSGNPRPDQKDCYLIDRRRSLALEALEPILRVPDVEFFSLQVPSPGGARSAGVAARAGAAMQDYTSDLRDFADTAALMTQLDLVITVDTSVAHVAGAIGRPVWMLNRYDSCWRWGSDGARSLWYPTMCIFRQKAMGEWGPVVDEVRDALHALGQSHRQRA